MKTLRKVLSALETLFDAGWFSYVKLSDETGVIVEKKDGVTVLPFIKGGVEKPFYLLHERMAATLSLAPTLCSLTGSIDGDDSPFDTALRELREEAGLVILASSLYPLGEYIHTYKGCTKKTWMFAANVTNAYPVEAQGDGSAVEKEAFCQYHTLADLVNCQDALLLASLARFQNMYPRDFQQTVN